jgi:hypothetical protein
VGSTSRCTPCTTCPPRSIRHELAGISDDKPALVEHSDDDVSTVDDDTRCEPSVVHHSSNVFDPDKDEDVPGPKSGLENWPCRSDASREANKSIVKAGVFVGLRLPLAARRKPRERSLTYTSRTHKAWKVCPFLRVHCLSLTLL